MATKNPKALVIDASVLRASGDKGLRPSRCQKFLDEVHVQEHQVVVTPAIEKEWNDHPAPFAMTWRVAMKSKRLTLRRPDQEWPALRDAVAAAAPEDGRQLMTKDLLLVEAAAAADQIIISHDTRAGGKFALLSQTFADLRPFVWMVPNQEGERGILWLRRGAPPEPDWQLGRAGAL
jgi:hypothetical protein